MPTVWKKQTAKTWHINEVSEEVHCEDRKLLSSHSVRRACKRMENKRYTHEMIVEMQGKLCRSFMRLLDGLVETMRNSRVHTIKEKHIWIAIGTHMPKLKEQMRKDLGVVKKKRDEHKKRDEDKQENEKERRKLNPYLREIGLYLSPSQVLMNMRLVFEPGWKFSKDSSLLMALVLHTMMKKQEDPEVKHLCNK